MQRMRNKLNQLISTPWICLLVSFAMAAVFFLLSAQIQSVAYQTNDDNAIAFALAGYQTGAPYPNALFIHCALGSAFAFLYRAFPNLAWWGIIQIALLLVSESCIFFCILSFSGRRGVPFAASAAVLGLFAIVFFLPSAVEITYTVTACIAGCAGLALIIYAADRDRLWILFPAVLLIISAYLYRKESGYVILCYLVPAAGIACWLNPVRRRVLIAVSTGVILLCGVLGTLNRSVRESVNGEEYVRFSTYRERFTDYPRDTYQENPELYLDAGWDEELYELADNWCFLDPRVNAESLHRITDGSVRKGYSLSGALNRMLSFFAEEHSALGMSAGILLLLILCWTMDGSGLLHWIAAAVFLGGAGMCFYLCLKGRFIFRSFETVCLPMAVLTLILLFFCPRRKERKRRTLAEILIAGICCICFATGLINAKNLRVNGATVQLTNVRQVNDYVMQHPDETFIRDAGTAADLDVFSSYPGTGPINLISWGGCGMYSDAYYQQLRLNGIRGIHSEILFEDSVYFLTKEDSRAKEILDAYLKTIQPAGELVLRERFGSGYAVYAIKTMKEEPV